MGAASSSEARALAPTHPRVRGRVQLRGTERGRHREKAEKGRMERQRRCELRSTRAWSVPNTKLSAFPIRLWRAEFPVRSAQRTRHCVGSHGSGHVLGSRARLAAPLGVSPALPFALVYTCIFSPNSF